MITYRYTPQKQNIRFRLVTLFHGLGVQLVYSLFGGKHIFFVIGDALATTPLDPLTLKDERNQNNHQKKKRASPEQRERQDYKNTRPNGEI